jgi:hypothetical protein
VTPTQLSFAFFLVVVAPLFGIAGALRREGWRQRAAGFVVCAGCASIALALSGVIAALMHPRYPAQGPPEFKAILYVLPGYLVGALAVAAVWRRASTSKIDAFTVARVAASCALTIATLVSAALYAMLIMPQHHALPWSASDVRESYWGETLLPDFEYRLKARVSEGELYRYLARRTMDPVSHDVAMPGPPYGERDASWWDPPSATHMSQRGERAGYRDGYLYVWAGDE